jgi:hypothetical protein
MNESDWLALADKAVPLPEDIPPERLLKEMEMYMLAKYDRKWGLVG